MTTIFDTVFRISSQMTETGLLAMDVAMKSVRSAVDRVAGIEAPRPPAEPPLNGLPTLDESISDFYNRMLSILWRTGGSPQMLKAVLSDLLHASQESFAGLELKDPRRWLALPFQIPLSLGTLMTQSGLRGIYGAHSVGWDRILEFAAYMTDSFTDTHVYVSLDYRKQLNRYKQLLAENPDDGAIRVKLADTLMKLGLYPEASREFRIAAEQPSFAAEALRQSAVALYRAGNFKESAADGSSSLSLKPDDQRTRYWLWLAADRLGGYPPEIPQAHQCEVKLGQHRPKVELEEVSHKIGLDKTSGGRGIAILDINGDGYLDVVIASAHGGCNVYRNNGDGTFTDASVGSGIDECLNTFVMAAGDYNNDGLDDIYVTRLGFYAGQSVLYRNNGDGTFTDVTEEAGIGCWGPAFTAQWVDYDCDGHLDLFVASNLAELFDRKNPNRLFHNNGDGTFTEVASAAGIDTIHPTIGSAWGDYDNDGFPDLFLSNGLGRSQLFHNNGDGTFTDVSAGSGLDGICLGSVAFWCDYDNDGWLDLVQFIWSPEEDVLYTLMNGEGPPHGNPMRIYHNNRDGSFTLRSRELGLDGCFGTMSGNAGDFNNDGYLDFLIGNGDPHMDRTEPSIVLEFDEKEGKYKNVTFAAGLPFTGKGHGANMADLAGDGRLSLIMGSGGAYPGDLLTISVFRPKELPGNYLNVRLVGTSSNRNAIGARIRLDAGGRSQHRLVNGGSGFGYLPLEQHFGLKDLTKVDAIEIRWPSGLNQSIANPPTNTSIRITEGIDGWEEVYKKEQTVPAVAAAL